VRRIEIRRIVKQPTKAVGERRGAFSRMHVRERKKQIKDLEKMNHYRRVHRIRHHCARGNTVCRNASEGITGDLGKGS